MAISVTEEVRHDVLNQLEDMKRGQPAAHVFVYDEIIGVVKTAKLLVVVDVEE
jgi:hypothetical protein